MRFTFVALQTLMQMRKLLVLLCAILATNVATAQSSVQQVYDLFQANCATACHNGTGPGVSPVFSTGGDLNAFRSALVNVDPLNPAAQAKGYKLIDPGHPHSSFILQKLAHNGWDAAYGLDAPEGNPMPDGQPSLAAKDIELVRQWILFGAPASGQVVSPQTLNNYYNVNGMARMTPPAPPAAGSGFQVHMGPFFINPSEEKEFYLKHHLNNIEQQKIVRMDVVINDESHPYLLFQFEPGAQNQLADGLRPVNVSNVFPDQTKYMVGWVDSDSTELPDGTAYYLEPGTYLDLNYHILNYAFNGDSVLAAEAYVNFYTENTEEKIQMFSDLLIYPPTQLLIFNSGQAQTFTDHVYESGVQDSMYVWFLSSHTHKYGLDYDIYKRNPDGTKGEQLYEGFYNTTYAFNQGYYDWQHPANLYLDEVFGELMPIKRSEGLVQEAQFRINDPNEGPFVGFGLTTDDEMMLAFIQYTLQRPGTTGISGPEMQTELRLQLFPNPAHESVSLKLPEATYGRCVVEVIDATGRVCQKMQSMEMRGEKGLMFNVGGLPSGVYTVRVDTGAGKYTARLMRH